MRGGRDVEAGGAASVHSTPGHRCIQEMKIKYDEIDSAVWNQVSGV